MSVLKLFIFLETSLTLDTTLVQTASPTAGTSHVTDYCNFQDLTLKF